MNLEPQLNRLAQLKQLCRSAISDLIDLEYSARCEGGDSPAWITVHSKRALVNHLEHEIEMLEKAIAEHQ